MAEKVEVACLLFLVVAVSPLHVVFSSPVAPVHSGSEPLQSVASVVGEQVSGWGGARAREQK